MSVKESRIARAKMTVRERSLRSQMNQIVGAQGFVHGTLLDRKRSCGQEGCRCARGEKHPGLYLVIWEEGRQKQIFIPKAMEATVRLWVAHDHKIQQLRDALSRMSIQKIKKREV